MIKVIYRDVNEVKIKVLKKEDFREILKIQNILWIDVVNSDYEEIKLLAAYLNIKIPSKEEVEEIEISSRYWEEKDYIKINTYFLIEEKTQDLSINFVENESITFILRRNILISVRYKELTTFNEVLKKVIINPKMYKNGLYIFADILSIRIDKDADFLEKLTKEISKLSKYTIAGVDITEEIIETISSYEEINMTIRENLIDKQRVLSSLLKSYQIPNELKEEFRIMIKDVASLINYTSFNFDKLTYLQNTFLGLINLKQNRIIKVLTVISVLFAPATLIASIFGMNFPIPFGESVYSFFFAVLLILISMLFAYLYFKKLN
ncbi:MAG: magnesium and cobalt transport protein CorA [Persephonella sp.]|nr:MAG: magnesium and cobalt transport protein CorA [Persephonella sp.]RUM61595.1 MAG: magnesium and cobalt transport protein CorA [Persephonella sp.]